MAGEPRDALRRAAYAPAILRLIGNILWLLISGLTMAVGYLVAGVLLCITIIGIPFGIVSFGLTKIGLAPLGRRVVPIGNAA